VCDVLKSGGYAIAFNQGYHPKDEWRLLSREARALFLGQDSGGSKL